MINNLIRPKKISGFLFVAVIVLFSSNPVEAKKWVISPNGSDLGTGSQQNPFRTISKGAELAQPGDTVFVLAGVYREWVAPARGGMEGQPITYLGDPNEQVIIKGSEVFSGVWYPVNEHPGVYFSEIPDNFFSPSFNPFKITFSKSRGGGTQGQVFIDGIELTEAKNNDNPDHGIRTVDSVRTKKEIMLGQENSWFAENGNKIYVHLPKDFGPIEKSTVEISVRRHLFAPVRRSQNYINIKGFIFEHCANDASFPQVGAVSCRSGQHWTIENNVIRNIKTIGLDFGAEDENPWLLPDILPEDRYLVSRHEDVFTLAERRIPGRHRILNNIVSDCGQCGIAGLFSDGTVIMGNTIERCGGVVPGFESGGIKVHGLMGGTVEANLVRDNESWGIWLDCGYIGSRVTRNVVVNNKISGIFFECSNGPGLIDNNVVAYNRGDGIYAHDASGITVANNLIFGNTNFGIYMCVAGDRLVPSYYYATGLLETELSACSWERISNNVFSGNEEGAISLPYPSARAQDNLTDNNLFDEKQFTPRFVQHFRNGEPNTSELATNEARNAFSKSGDAGLSGADLVLWKNDKGISMNMTQWQLATGNDKNSLTGNVSCQLDLNTFELIVYLDEKLHQMDCKPVHALNVRDFEKFSREIDKDFLSKPMGSKIVLPGAFQNFKIGNNTIKIWPVEFEYPAMPPKVLIQPDPGAPGLMPIPPPDNRPGY